MTDRTDISKFVCAAKGRRTTASKRAVLAVLVASMAVSGCAINNNTLPQIANDKSIVTDSVAKTTGPKGIAKGDADVIKSAVAQAPIEERIKPLAWSNPETGSTGTIVAIDKFMGKHGQQCRGFKTSVDTFMGIAFYNGEACQISPGEWVLSWFKSSG
ncbi:MAG: RT0821/Lpp0805 family surface protein [Pseudomonadota bacterium]